MRAFYSNQLQTQLFLRKGREQRRREGGRMNESDGLWRQRTIPQPSKTAYFQRNKIMLIEVKNRFLDTISDKKCYVATRI